MHIIHHDHKQGFTIIEVSLVLAIAGLIFVMIFVALPALQRQARDTERREDTLTLIGAIKKYQQNNRGSLPNFTDKSEWDDFYTGYLGDNFINPTSGRRYTQSSMPCEANLNIPCKNIDIDIIQNGDYNWYIFTGATCENNFPIKSSNNRNVAVVVKLETDIYCANT